MIRTTTYVRDPARFDMCGRFLGHDLREVSADIRVGLARRLVRYAEQRLLDSGFVLPPDWAVGVQTSDGDQPASERIYHVTWTTPKGGELGVGGIMTKNGWPFLDHGFHVA